MEYRLGIYDLCGNNNFLKEVADGFCVIPKNEAPVCIFGYWYPYIYKLFKHGVTTDQLFIEVR